MSRFLWTKSFFFDYFLHLCPTRFRVLRCADWVDGVKVMVR